MAEPKAVMGRPRKFDVTVTMSFDLDKKMYDAIEDKAYESNMSTGDLIRRSVMDDHLKQGDRSPVVWETDERRDRWQSEDE